MKRVLIFLLLLLAGQALAQPVECDDHSLRINLMPSAVGNTLTKDDFRDLPAGFMAVVDSVNANQCRLVVEVSNDSTKWRMLRLMAQDPRYKGVDFKTMNLVFDAALNVARRQAVEPFFFWLGVSPNAIVDYRPLRDEEKCFVKIYSAPLLPYQQPRVIERIVEKPASERPAMTMDLSGFKLPKLPKLAFALQPGVSSTWHGATPALCFNLVYGHWLAQAYGFHSLFVRYEREVMGGKYETYDQGVGVLFGRQIGRPLWLVAGYSGQENLLDATDQAGNRLFRFRGGEAGLLITPINGLNINLTGLYGHTKCWDASESTDVGCRIAVYFGKKWRG